MERKLLLQGNGLCGRIGDTMEITAAFQGEAGVLELREEHLQEDIEISRAPAPP
jgi:hypothetical protein